MDIGKKPNTLKTHVTSTFSRTHLHPQESHCFPSILTSTNHVDPSTHLPAIPAEYPTATPLNRTVQHQQAHKTLRKPGTTSSTQHMQTERLTPKPARPQSRLHRPGQRLRGVDGNAAKGDNACSHNIPKRQSRIAKRSVGPARRYGASPKRSHRCIVGGEDSQGPERGRGQEEEGQKDGKRLVLDLCGTVKLHLLLEYCANYAVQSYGVIGAMWTFLIRL
jgi:hypothetical protein